MEESRQGGLMRLGLIVFIIGTILIVAQYALANTVRHGVILPIYALALFYTAISIKVFMHITQLWHPEE